MDNDLGEHVSVYLDDICIGGNDEESMLNKLQALFNRIRAAGFLLKAKKCALFQKETPYLGHILSKEGIQTDKNKIQKILAWPRPQDAKS